MNVNILIMVNSNTVEITTFSLHGWFNSLKFNVQYTSESQKRKYILFILMRIKCILEQSKQVYTVNSSCLTLISHANQVLSDVIISHISTFYSLLSWRWSCLSLCFQSILWKRRGNWPLNWSVFNSFIMLFTIQAFLFLFITNL